MDRRQIDLPVEVERRISQMKRRQVHDRRVQKIAVENDRRKGSRRVNSESINLKEPEELVQNPIPPFYLFIIISFSVAAMLLTYLFNTL